MTYNFDPEAWLERELAALGHRRATGCIDDAEYEAARADLDRRYDDMVARLDGTFRLPGGDG